MAAPPQQIVAPPARERCDPGTVLSRGVCVPDLQCAAPAKANSKGTFCICPNQTIAGAKGCEPDKPDPISCNAPAVANKAGTACICPKGTIEQGKRGLEVIVEEEPDPQPDMLQCRPPAVPNRRGTECVCPQGMVGDGRRCVDADIEIEVPKGALDDLFDPDKRDK